MLKRQQRDLHRARRFFFSFSILPQQFLHRSSFFSTTSALDPGHINKMNTNLEQSIKNEVRSKRLFGIDKSKTWIYNMYVRWTINRCFYHTQNQFSVSSAIGPVSKILFSRWDAGEPGQEIGQIFCKHILSRLVDNRFGDKEKWFSRLARIQQEQGHFQERTFLKQLFLTGFFGLYVPQSRRPPPPLQAVVVF